MTLPLVRNTIKCATGDACAEFIYYVYHLVSSKPLIIIYNINKTRFLNMNDC